MKTRIAFLHAAILSLALAGHTVSTLAQTNLDSGEQEVLQAFLTPASEFQMETTNFVVMEITSSDRVRKAAGRLREEVSGPGSDASLREAVEDLIRKSKVDVRVRVPTNQTAHVTIISEAEREAILSGPGPAGRFGWTKFFQKFPGARGTTWISRIGVDSKRTVAIVDVTVSANGGGGTRFYVLRRQGNVWRSTGESVLGFENRYGLAKPDAASPSRFNQPRQPTPMGRLAVLREPLAQLGCALRSSQTSQHHFMRQRRLQVRIAAWYGQWLHIHRTCERLLAEVRRLSESPYVCEV